MSDLLLHRVRVFLLSHRLFSPEALLLVAVSGGPDSLCLLHLLYRLAAQGGPRLHVAHLDHGLRPEAVAEASRVAALAAAWGLPATVERRAVRTRPGDGGPMAAARRVRYAFLAELARASGANAVAVAHQADDQAETVLMHLIRGAGLAGLRGMRAAVPWEEWGQRATEARNPEPVPAPLHAPALIRPLLDTTRTEITGYCAEHGLAPVADPSNSSPRYARSRVRRLLHDLAAENPQVVEAIGRSATLVGDDFAYIQSQLAVAWPGLAIEAPGQIAFARPAWEHLHPALQRYALRRAAGALGAPELSMPQVEAARALATRPGRRMRLGANLRLEVEHARIVMTRPEALAPAAAPQLAVDELPLATPGVTPLGRGWRCVVGPTPAAPPSPWQVALRPETLDGPLRFRRRRPGDRFRPVGGPGSRKLQDFFVDRKVPRDLRDAWPILATPTSIVWVAGLRPDGRFVAEARSQSTIWVSLLYEPET